MKLIIDIPEEMYNDANILLVKELPELKKIIANGTPYEAQQNGNWIPVVERLPKRYEEVIVTDIETSDVYIARYVGNMGWECDDGFYKNRIVAWQPLPEPYKKEVD